MQNAARARIRNLINWLAAGRRTRSQSAAADTNPELISSAGKCVEGLRNIALSTFIPADSEIWSAAAPDLDLDHMVGAKPLNWRFAGHSWDAFHYEIHSRATRFYIYF